MSEELIFSIETFLVHLLYQLQIIAPYWLIGILIGSFLQEPKYSRFLPAVLEKITEKNSLLLAFYSSIAGALSPLCLYGSVPIMIALYRNGLRPSAITAFLIASPFINPNLFIFSLALGLPLALSRVISAVFIGMLAGVLVESRNIDPFKDFLAKTNEDNNKMRKTNNRWQSFLIIFGKNLRFTAPLVLLGITLAVGVDLYMPREPILKWLGPENDFAVLIAALLAIPSYFCGGGTIPLLRDLLFLGISPGAIIAFMIMGPATKLTNLFALKLVTDVRWIGVFIIISAVGALILGYLGHFALAHILV